MSLIDALAMLKDVPVAAVRTNDAAALWKVLPVTASKMLARLAQAGHIVCLQRGLWITKLDSHPWAVAPYVTDPSPCYISLQTALFHHGMIEQVPSIIHLISFARAREIKTSVGTYAVHCVSADFFFGFEPFGNTSAQIATPEKALVDFLYFTPTKTRAFRSLPELELPRVFGIKKARNIVKQIKFAGRRSLVSRLLEEIVHKSSAR